MSPDLPLWRSLLIVPANVPRFVDKASRVPADVVILDLEDSVPHEAKAAARESLAQAAVLLAGTSDVLVRINRPLALSVGDIEAAIGPDVTGLLLPKIDDAAHVRLLIEMIEQLERQRGMSIGHTRLVPLIETATGYRNMAAIAASDERIVAMLLGPEDFALSTGTTVDSELVRLAQQQLVIAASAAGILPLGLIDPAPHRYLTKCRAVIARSRRLGFTGSPCIHPSLVPLLNDGFGPSSDELAEARAIVAAFDHAHAQQRGSTELDGRMIDLPVVRQAERILALAERVEERSARLR